MYKPVCCPIAAKFCRARKLPIFYSYFIIKTSWANNPARFYLVNTSLSNQSWKNWS